MSVAGVVKASMSNKHVLGLGNMTNKVWSVKTPDGQIVEVKPNAYAKLAPGMEIDFNGTVGKIF